MRNNERIVEFLTPVAVAVVVAANELVITATQLALLNSITHIICVDVVSGWFELFQH